MPSRQVTLQRNRTKPVWSLKPWPPVGHLTPPA